MTKIARKINRERERERERKNMLIEEIGTPDSRESVSAFPLSAAA
jgi:hypothetical protein